MTAARGEGGGEERDAAAVLGALRALAGTKRRAHLERLRIDTRRALGIPLPALRALARKVGRSHALARALWASGVHEARVLASLVDEPERVTRAQMERWARDFASWDLCDQCCGNLFARAPFAREQALAWSRARPEFVKRAGFALMAALAVADKGAPDAAFEPFLAAILGECGDERDYVRKAVNWALRQIGKRNLALNARAVATAERVRAEASRPARWIAAGALRELTDPKVVRRLKGRAEAAATAAGPRPHNPHGVGREIRPRGGVG